MKTRKQIKTKEMYAKENELFVDRIVRLEKRDEHLRTEFSKLLGAERVRPSQWSERDELQVMSWEAIAFRVGALHGDARVFSLVQKLKQKEFDIAELQGRLSKKENP